MLKCEWQLCRWHIFCCLNWVEIHANTVPAWKTATHYSIPDQDCAPALSALQSM